MKGTKFNLELFNKLLSVVSITKGGEEERRRGGEEERRRGG